MPVFIGCPFCIDRSYAVGDDIAVLRVNPNSDPDTSFDGDGKVTADFHDLDEATAVAIDQQDRIVVGGASLEEATCQVIRRATVTMYTM
jgi:hypothetical protein